MSQERRAFSREFKQQMVDLVENGKSKKEVIREYNLGSSSLDRWILQANRSGSFIEKENLMQGATILFNPKVRHCLKMSVCTAVQFQVGKHAASSIATQPYVQRF